MTEPSDHPGRVRVVSSALALHTADDAVVPEQDPPPVGAVLHPPAPSDPALRQWFVVQAWSEVQLAVRMYFDSRYRISRTTQFLTPVILGLFVFNYFVFSMWLPVIPIISPIVERVGCVLLGVLAYKLLVRELARYRDVLDYLSRYGHR
ncbi:MAG: hypothetical protein K2X82_20100 [Gemmataceae bacterium]|nr:hypothetical protein [Gemmataceae bacterium]